MLIILLLNTLSIGLAYVLEFFNPLIGRVLQLWWVTQMRSRVSNSIPNSIQLDGRIHVIGTGDIKLGEYCRIGDNVILETQGDGSITIGSNVRINQGSVLVAYDNMVIGNDCLIGEYCSIRDANHGIQKNKLIRTQEHNHAPIVIENDCWIARGVMVLKGVTLRKGSVVGANSVVLREVLEDEVVVGGIAKRVKARGI